jgi:ketosteroid isomerase-like protein
MKTPTEVALLGFRFLAEGHKAGSFQNYLDLLTDDYFFFAPVGEYRGENKGKERAAKFYQSITDAKADFIFSEPLRVTANGNTVVIEFTDQGTLMGNRYFNRIASSFDIRGEEICGYREYFGDIDVAALARMIPS